MPACRIQPILILVIIHHRPVYYNK